MSAAVLVALLGLTAAMSLSALGAPWLVSAIPALIAGYLSASIPRNRHT